MSLKILSAKNSIGLYSRKKPNRVFWKPLRFLARFFTLPLEIHLKTSPLKSLHKIKILTPRCGEFPQCSLPCFLQVHAAIPLEIPCPSEFQNSILSQDEKQGLPFDFFCRLNLVPRSCIVDTKLSGRHPKLILTNTKSFQDKFLMNVL